jgi:thiol:disulfide interchange protein DsbD
MNPAGPLSDLISQHGLGAGLFAVFFGGMALNLTPCVYPMIPVTLAFFSGQSQGSTRGTLLLAVCYVMGIALSYAALGFLASRTGALLGSWLQQPMVLITIALVIVALALSLFGLYELQPPRFVVERMGSALAGAGGAWVMGLLVGVVAAPCVGPFLLGLMLLASQIDKPAIGFLLFFVMGLGMGLPYIVLALAVGRIQRLPKAGTWLVWVKRGFGCLLIGLAAYLVRPLLPDSWMSRLQPPRTAVSGVQWVPFNTQALTAALVSGRPTLVELYADWCLPCVELEHVTFRNPQVIQALGRLNVLRVDATHEFSPDAEALAQRYDLLGVPTVLVFDRSGKERADLRLLGFEPPENFLRRLEKLERS